jgi:hypothetical protein
MSLDRIDRNHTVGWESMHFGKVMIETNLHGGQILMEHLFRLKCMGKLEWQSITAECGQSTLPTEAISAMLRSRQKWIDVVHDTIDIGNKGKVLRNCRKF